MTRKELFIREQAALSAYRDNDIDRGVDYIVQLLDRNKEMKFYRFRPARQHEIDAIENAKIICVVLKYMKILETVSGLMI